METGIRSIKTKTDLNGSITSVNIVFGLHYFFDLVNEDGHLMFFLGTTHHGFKADASEIGKGLEEMVETIREKFPQSNFD